MDFDLFDNKGCPLDEQRFAWRELVQKPISKLDDDAFTRIRVILMNGVETDALRFKHIAARRNHELRIPLADIRRAEQHQATLVNWLLPADQSPVETTIAYEQVAVEVTAAVAQNEPNEYLAQAYRFGLLEDFDHLYRYAALLDRLEGKDANNITQGYTDIIPGRATAEEHRAPEDDVREPYPPDAAPITKINAMLITASESARTGSMTMATLDQQGKDREVLPGHGTESLGPSDTSDTRSDVVGGPGLGRNVGPVVTLDTGTNLDTNLGIASPDATAGVDVGDGDLGSDSDAAGTGEHVTAGRVASEPVNTDRDVDRIVSADDPSLGLTEGEQLPDGRTIGGDEAQEPGEDELDFDADDILDEIEADTREEDRSSDML